ncbi:transcriptional regulator [Streptococcus criceti]|uniref:Transcriptional regulator, GntR family n=1 Tax=Streptococcus criceti HS-6 TaxID=873449 RepID=G5JP98_STRCG|nr:GntR family transcriptional regulator [Streptococcus criceti]EHI75062.1 transcriptional regulator, GntR family [Streptococcus criceti HS-6]SUN41822.1 transcriptional regulator [Streptococcus criceti]
MSQITQAIKNNLDLSQNVPLKVSFYEALKKTIIMSEIPAGSHINEKELAETLNISRTPIRYALGVLKEEKLVEHIPKKGIIVRGISLKDAIEIFDIRKALDTLASIKAMHLMTEEDFADMKKILTDCEAMIEDGDIQQILQNFNQFNELIYEKSQMLRLREIVMELQTYLRYFREISIGSLERRKRALSEHWIIYRGMKNKDTEQITLITHEHLNASLEFIKQEMERRQHGQ